MDFSFNEEQQELRTIARSFLAEHSGSEQVRTAMASELGYDPAVWKQVGSELGWASIHVPEAYGGLGWSYVELVALQEVIGESLLCAPYFSTVCLAANAILCAGSEEQKRQWLPDLAAGERTATLALAEDAGVFDASGVQASALRDGRDWLLRGTKHAAKHYVVDGHSADLLIVAARAAGGVELFAVPADAPGLSRRGLPTVDQTRRLARVVLDEVRVPESARLPGGEPGLEKALQLACVALAAEQVGGAQRCLDMAVSYAKEREQFGRPIGSFQAIKHKCADMMVAVESARSAVYYAGCAAAEDSSELPQVASLAKAWASDAYFRCAADSIQIHGGVGFTWEYDCHLYFKRAKSSESLLGDPDYHRERVAQSLEL